MSVGQKPDPHVRTNCDSYDRPHRPCRASRFRPLSNRRCAFPLRRSRCRARRLAAPFRRSAGWFRAPRPRSTCCDRSRLGGIASSRNRVTCVSLSYVTADGIERQGRYACPPVGILVEPSVPRLVIRFVGLVQTCPARGPCPDVVVDSFDVGLRQRSRTRPCRSLGNGSPDPSTG